jgi:signal transduction histidine kinase
MKKTVYLGVHKLLLVSMIVVPAVPLLLAATIGYYSYSNTTEQLAVSAIRQSAMDHRDMIDAFLKERRSDLEGFLDLIPTENMTSETGRNEIGLMLRTGGNAFSDIGLIDPDGVQVLYVGNYELVRKKYRDALWYRQALEKGYYVSDVFLGYRNVPHFVVAVTRRVDGRPWVLRATIDSDVFRRLVERVSIGDTGEAYVISLDGTLQTRRRSGGGLLEHDPYPYPRQEKGIMTFMGEDGDVPYLFASALINDGNWRLVVRQKRADAFHSATAAAYTVVFILLIGGVVIVGLAFVFSQRVYATLERQANAVCSLESQLMRAARLAELGEMSAGFAHEINNPLQIMKSDLALLDMTIDDLATKELSESDEAKARAEVREIVEQLKLQIDRCAGITREILHFGRYGAPELVSIDLASYLPGVGSMVEKKAVVHGIALRFDVATRTPDVEADPRQLQQVMVNLLNNAIHAVVERHGAEGGAIDVTADMDDNGNAVIRVADNGAGISQENLERIFLPFFSTKAPGQGTGLGLSVCHSIIDALGGELSVESVKGEGAVFTIVLPGSNR